MKGKLNKLLRQCSAYWIVNCEEPIIGLLVTKQGHHHTYESLTKYAVEKGWVTSKLNDVRGNKYESFYFTEKGIKEILNPLKEQTCITGRAIN